LWVEALKALSNLVISIAMLSILFPVGYIVLDRVRAAGSEIQGPSIYPLVIAYSIKNESQYMLVIVNLGPGKALLEGILDDGLGYHRAVVDISEGSTAIAFVGYKPYKLILRGGYVVEVRYVAT